MLKKQSWMKAGQPVIAYGKPGVIVKMQENQIDGVDYVYYINVRLNGQKHDAPYHPSDVKEAEVVEVAS